MDWFLTPILSWVTPQKNLKVILGIVPQTFKIAGIYYTLFCGSSQSRMPSPRKLNDRMVRKIASDGNRIRCG